MTGPFYLLYRTGFAPSNGTSVQLSRLLARHEEEIVHLMWDIEEGGALSVPRRVVVDDADSWQWPFRRGRGVYAKFRRLLQVGWWGGHNLNAAKLRKHLSSLPFRPGWAYIVCMREWDARRAFALLQALGRPSFVLHIMDIFHHELSPSDTPLFIELARGAQHVFCISKQIETEVRRWGARQTSTIPCVTDFAADERTFLEGPFRIVLTGSIWVDQYSYNPVLEILAGAWPEVVRRFPKVELHYAGSVVSRLPAVLRRVVQNHGLLPPSACEKLLKQCHIAVLPVSHPIDSVGRYSVPSRLADYLACGLPIITSTDDDTSIASFMRRVPRTCTANAVNMESLLAALERLGADPKAWAKASSDAARFASENLRAEKVSDELFKTLRDLR
jgi:glycosyltransferase involved in cell wall biosynthesis